VDIKSISNNAREAIAPLVSISEVSRELGERQFRAKRTEAGRQLPAYYFVYFLLVDLLRFNNLGFSEKTAWSIPVTLDGKIFFIEHRKFGVGVFATNLPGDESTATEIVHLIKKGIVAAQPYFEQRAAAAAAGSDINVVNRSSELFDRYNYFVSLYKRKHEEAEYRRNEQIVVREIFTNGECTTVESPAYILNKEAEWLAVAVIESFFSWTEHVFIHLAILTGACVTGEEVANLANSDWSKKYKAALGLNTSDSKRFHDELITIRRQIRNFVAHGSFGKQGEAFTFHSGAGAVPVTLSSHADEITFGFGGGTSIVEREAIHCIGEFVDYLWTGPRAPARIYLQKYNLPIILSRIVQGDYSRAMRSEADMTNFADHLQYELERAINMDF